MKAEQNQRRRDRLLRECNVSSAPAWLMALLGLVTVAWLATHVDESTVVPVAEPTADSPVPAA